MDRRTIIDDLIRYLRNDLIETNNEIHKLTIEKETYEKVIKELEELQDKE